MAITHPVIMQSKELIFGLKLQTFIIYNYNINLIVKDISTFNTIL